MWFRGQRVGVEIWNLMYASLHVRHLPYKAGLILSSHLIVCCAGNMMWKGHSICAFHALYVIKYARIPSTCLHTGWTPLDSGTQTPRGLRPGNPTPWHAGHNSSPAILRPLNPTPAHANKVLAERPGESKKTLLNYPRNFSSFLFLLFFIYCLDLLFFSDCCQRFP